MRFHIVAVIAAAVLVSRVDAQSSAAQLLPGSVTAGISLQWQQDGRVVDYTVRNPVATWVVTEMTVIVGFKEFVPPPLPASALPSPKPSARKLGVRLTAVDNLIASGYRYVEQPETHAVKITVLPNGETVSRIELKSESQVESVRIGEARGRAPTLLEKLRDMVR